MTMGRRLLQICEDAKDGNAHDFAHYVRASRTAFTLWRVTHPARSALSISTRFP